MKPVPKQRGRSVRLGCIDGGKSRSGTLLDKDRKESKVDVAGNGPQLALTLRKSMQTFL
jgi:hypothetical protein